MNQPTETTMNGRHPDDCPCSVCAEWTTLLNYKLGVTCWDDPTQDAIATLAAYHRQCAECCSLCDERQCDCDICKTYRKTDRERETYFQDLIARVGEHAAYAYWQQARTLAPLMEV